MADEWEDGAPGLKSIFRQLSEISKPSPEEDDFVPPTQKALERAIDVVESANYRVMAEHCQIPEGSVKTDDNGRVRIEWWHGRRYCVTLVVGRDEDAKSYVFVQLEADNPGTVNERILPVRLASQLKKLSEIQDRSSE